MKCNFNNGLGDLYSKLGTLDAAKKRKKLILSAVYAKQPDLQW